MVCEATGDERMSYTIDQRPCPECGHEQHDMVMDHRDLVKNEAVEALCTECGTAYIKPILKDGKPKIPRNYRYE